MKNIYIFLLLIPTLTLAQDRYTFAIFPECPISEKNEEMKNCFITSLSEKLKSNLDPTILSLIKEKNIKQLIIYFNVEKDGKLSSFKTPSYSDVSIAKYFNERFVQYSEYLDNSEQHIIPAMFNEIPGKIELSAKLEF
ncbi:hypothetical protein [Chishuiella changwenlii]|jgi:hypothetical protein|uniref:hypothetical protein n=1 Tax=Chishuiella changwenlii TaxID=1434701 RepID=UPI002FD9DA4A